MNKESPHIARFFNYAFLFFILVNPITLFLLTKNILATTIIFIGFSTITILMILKFSNLRIKIYYFNLLFLVSICYHAELIFRVNFSEYNIPNLYEIRGKYYFNKANLTQVLDDGEYITDYVTNKQGFRISISLDPNTEVKKCDWLFLGDSYTQGAQVNYEDLFTSKLYRYYPDRIIVNAGISGYSIIDSYNYYKNEGYKLNPDKVFLQLCIFNDFMNVIPTEIGWSEYLIEYSELYRYMIYNTKYQSPKSLPLQRFTEPFYEKINDNIDYNIFYKNTSERKETDIENLKYYLQKMNEEVVRHGSELIVVLIPTKEQTNYKYFEQVISSFHLDVAALDMKFPNNLMREFASLINFKLIDLLDSFLVSPSNLFYDQDEHLNVNGHARMADIIATNLKEHGNSYNYLSKLNNGNRYPTFFNKDSLVLYQGVYNGFFQLFFNTESFDDEKTLRFSNIDKIHPALSGDRKCLAYTQGNQESGKTSVILEDLIDNKTIVIGNGQDRFAAIPSFSFSGEYIVFPSWVYKDGLFSNPVITLYDVKNNAYEYLTEDLEESWRPVFHPNDSIVYFIARENSENHKLKTVNIYTKEEKLLLAKEFDIWDPAISKDGNLIAFAGRINDNWDLFLLNIENDSLIQLTNSKGNEWDPSFSISQNKLIFAGSFGLNNGIYTLELKK